MNVLFIQDFGINESLALTELVAFLRLKGHDCDLLIERNERNLLQAINKVSAGIFIIPWDIGALSWVLKITSKIRRNFNQPILFCGTYPSFYPDVAINFPGIDMICIGETEYAIAELLEKLEHKESLMDIRNIWIKKEGRIHKNELRPLISDLDTLPMPERSIYYKYSYLKNFSLKRFISGRGCLNSCSFCYNSLFRRRYEGKGNYVRRKSVSRIVREIEELRSKSILKSVHFSDDIFISDKSWLREFNREYKKLRLPFTCNASAELIDEEAVALLKESGCSGMALGIETGNQSLRNFVLNKKISNHQIIEAGRLIKKYKIFLTTFNMIAFPEETISDAFETIGLNNRINADHVRLSFAFPLPGTAMAEYGIGKNLFSQAHIERLLDNTLYPTNAIPNSSYKKQFENLFHFFGMGVRFPLLAPWIKKAIGSPLSKIFSLPNSLMNLYREKMFFQISFRSGIIYMLNAGSYRRRTKVFNNYMP